jgi:hypothetical protein
MVAAGAKLGLRNEFTIMCERKSFSGRTRVEGAQGRRGRVVRESKDSMHVEMLIVAVFACHVECYEQLPEITCCPSIVLYNSHCRSYELQVLKYDQTGIDNDVVAAQQKAYAADVRISNASAMFARVLCPGCPPMPISPPLPATRFSAALSISFATTAGCDQQLCGALSAAPVRAIDRERAFLFAVGF